MQFKPRTEEELKAEEAARLESLLWPAGEYECTVIEAIPKTSKEKFDSQGNVIGGGNPMIELKINIFNSEGKFQQIFDYIMEQMAFKMRHACYAFGLGEDYESGHLTATEFVGKTARAIIDIRPAKDGYQARNQIKDYIVPPAEAVKSTAAKTKKAQEINPDFNDEIPF